MERQNAVMHRIWQMRDMWGNAWQNDPAAIIWKIKSEESTFPDCFEILEESNESSSFEEYFIRFDTSFVSLKQYSSDLLERLINMRNETVKHDDGTYLPGADTWKPLYQDWSEKEKALPEYFIDNLESLITSTGYPADKKIVLYLMPLEIGNKSQWNEWISKALVRNPIRTVIMLKEHVEYPSLSISGKAKQKVEILEPKINLNDIIKQEAKAGNASDPNAKFRLYIIEMAEAAGIKDFSKIESIGKKAILLANEMKRPDMEAITVITMGIHYVALKKNNEAHEKLRQAGILCNLLIDSGNAIGYTLSLQTEGTLASMFFTRKEYDTAREHYVLMGEFAKHALNKIYQVEALRMSAMCEKKSKRYREAALFNLKAIELGDTFTEEERLLTSLPLVYTEMEELAKYLPDNMKSRLKETHYV